MKKRVFHVLIFMFCVIPISDAFGKSPASNHEKRVMLDFLNLRFGMFIHYDMSTFHGEQWATPGHLYGIDLMELNMVK